MNKKEFRQWFYDHFNVGNNCTVGLGLLDAILDHAEKLKKEKQQAFLKEMFANIDVKDDEIGEARFYDWSNEREGVCPMCGSKIDYLGNAIYDDSGCSYPWQCQTCGATGREGFNLVFDRHYDVQNDADDSRMEYDGGIYD